MESYLLRPMLFYRKYDHGFTSSVLTREEFHALKSKITAAPDSYPFPSSSSAEYRKALWAELKDMYRREIFWDFVFSFGGLLLAITLYVAAFFIERVMGWSGSGFSWFVGLIIFVVLLKLLLHVVGVMISVVNFSGWFEARKRFYRQVYEMIRYYPDYDSYLGAYRDRVTPLSGRMIT